MKVSNLEFAQKYRKIEFLEGKSSFKGQKSTVGFFFGKIEFPSKRTKKPNFHAFFIIFMKFYLCFFLRKAFLNLFFMLK